MKQLQKDYDVLTYCLSDNGSLSSKSSPSNNVGFASLGVAAASLTKDVMASYKKEVKKLLAEKQKQAEEDKKIRSKSVTKLTPQEKARCAASVLAKHLNPVNIKANKMFWAAAAVALGSLMYNKKESFKMPSLMIPSFGGGHGGEDVRYQNSQKQYSQ